MSETTGTSAELYEGDIYTIRQLLYAMMLPSGNDAAIALAKWAGRLLRTDREVDAFKLFVNCMNRTAIAINMKSSTFTNPHGLPNHLNCSTA